MKRAICALFLLLFAAPLHAIDITPGVQVLPHIVDGAYWRTIITLVNMNPTATDYTLYFYRDDDGSLSAINPMVGWFWRGVDNNF